MYKSQSMRESEEIHIAESWVKEWDQVSQVPGRPTPDDRAEPNSSKWLDGGRASTPVDQASD